MDEKVGILRKGDKILVTGATGFIGSKVVRKLLEHGWTNVRCFTRSLDLQGSFKKLVESCGPGRIEILQGDLSSSLDCEAAADGVRLVYHVAGGAQATSFQAAHKNSVDTMRVLLDALIRKGKLRRFVHVSSFAVYSNLALPAGALLDETCPLESELELRGEAYTYAKVMQERLLREYGSRYGMPYVILRPGAVYGPGNTVISGRVGIATSKLFFHFGDSNVIPFTYIDNCAEAIVLAGLKEGIENEAINVVDDGVMTSRDFLRMHKRRGVATRAISLPKSVSYALYCLLGVGFRALKRGVPCRYNGRRWCAYWKGNTYSNAKLKSLLGWSQSISMEEGMRRYFEYFASVGKYDA